MDMTQLATLMGGIFLTLACFIFAFSGPNAGKAQSRRLDGIKQRNQTGAAVAMETQLRKVNSSKNKAIEGLAQRFIPNPALLAFRLVRTGKGWSLGSYMLTCVAITFGVGAAIFLSGMPIYLAIPVGLLMGFGLPHKVTGFLINRRIKKFNVNFPDAIELMVRGLRSGLPISETLSVVGGELTGPIGEEFRFVGEKIRIGKTMDQALQETADKIGTPEVQFFCITLAIQRETGGNLAETLSNLAEVLRKRAQMKLKIKAMSSESKASAYIIGALPFMVFATIYTINSTYMGQFFTDPRLIALGLGGLCWMGIGAFVMAKMINFEI
jgi:tight adherence protein B